MSIEKKILVEISPGELIDKLTILQIKSLKITEASKLANVRHELEMLRSSASNLLGSSVELTDLTTRLRRVNERLWEVEDELRDCERNQDFGPRFVELARSVYRTNDERANLKRQINDLLGSKLIEEKSYARYN